MTWSADFCLDIAHQNGIGRTATDGSDCTKPAYDLIGADGHNESQADVYWSEDGNWIPQKLLQSGRPKQ